MSTFGVTPVGFTRKQLLDITGEMEQDEKAFIRTNLDVSPTSVFGQMNGIVGRQISIVWEQLEIIYHGNDPDDAEGRLLEMLSKLTGTFRNGNTKGRVVLNCDLDIDTTLLPGVHFVGVDTNPDIRWTPAADTYPSGYEATTTGFQSVTFEAEIAGVVPAYAGTISTILTPIAGWRTAVNPNDAEVGLEVDTDAQLARRREAELAAVGSATVPSITAKITRAFPTQITSLAVFENEEDFTDPATGLTAHSIEVMIFDGDVPAVNDAALAQVILDNKAGGVKTQGNTLSSATGLKNGVATQIPVRFTRAEQVPIYIAITVVKNPKAPASYAGDTAVAELVADAANAFFQPGDDVVDARIESFALSAPGVKDVTAVFLGLAASPTDSDNLLMTIRQVARFSSSRITVTST